MLILYWGSPLISHPMLIFDFGNNQHLCFSIEVRYRMNQEYDLLALYQDDAGYPAWNKAGFIAFLIPVGLTLIAITTGELGWFYTYGWFTGSILGGLIYYFVARGEGRSSS